MRSCVEWEAAKRITLAEALESPMFGMLQTEDEVEEGDIVQSYMHYF